MQMQYTIYTIVKMLNIRMHSHDKAPYTYYTTHKCIHKYMNYFQKIGPTNNVTGTLTNTHTHTKTTPKALQISMIHQTYTTKHSRPLYSNISSTILCAPLECSTLSGSDFSCENQNTETSPPTHKRQFTI